MTEELITCKELASLLKRSPSYVYAMRRRGFRMIAYRTTLGAALQWLAANSQPRKRAGTKTATRAHISL